MNGYYNIDFEITPDHRDDDTLDFGDEDYDLSGGRAFLVKTRYQIVQLAARTYDEALKLLPYSSRVCEAKRNTPSPRFPLVRYAPLHAPYANYNQGPLGMTLFPGSPELPESARETLSETKTEVRGLIKTARTDVENSWTQLAKDLEPTIKQLITEGKFATAVQIKRQLQVAPPLEFSIPIKFNRIAHTDHCWDAKLVDVRGENCFLVNTGHDRREWLPRCRIKFLPDDKVQTSTPENDEKPAGPGIPITAGMKLKKGQRAFKYWGHSWQPVTIVAVTPEGISFTWDGWNPREEVAERTEFLLLED